MREKSFFRTRWPRADTFSHLFCLQKGTTEQAKLIVNALIRHLPFAAIYTQESLCVYLYTPPTILIFRFRQFIVQLPERVFPGCSHFQGKTKPGSILLCPPTSVLHTLLGCPGAKLSLRYFYSRVKAFLICLKVYCKSK